MQESVTSMPQRGGKTLDAETLEFAQTVFQMVRCGDAERLGGLLAQGLPANLCNHRGDSLLMLASYHGHHEVADLLLEHGADAEMRNDHGQTPLVGAAYKGDLAMVQLLLDHGAHVEGAAPDGKTALMLAAMFDRSAVVDFLIARGANVEARDDKGMTALQMAIAMGARDTPAQLVDWRHRLQ